MKRLLAKKVIACVALALSVQAGVTAFAAEYNSIDNSVSESQALGYKTVIITKGETFPATLTDADIVYADQAASAFDAAASFMLKGETVDDGTYLITLGNAQGVPKSITFTVSNKESAIDDVGFTPVGLELQEETDGTKLYKKGFIATVDDIKNYNIIKISNGTQTGILNTDNYFGAVLKDEEAGNYIVGIQIYNIPEEVKDNLSISFSAGE
ncbi:MAG: hypothetical protein IJT23_08070 [Clostridia bacterium]|nr:hypothetical protein [Clostridia bacterium]